MNCVTRRLDDVATPTSNCESWLVPHECLDAAIAAQFEQDLESRLNRPLTLDLSRVRFADSSGLAVLVRCHARHPELAMANVRPSLALCFGRMPGAAFPHVVDVPPTPGVNANLQIARFSIAG